MADYPDKTTDRYVRESTYRVEAPPADSNNSMWFILGGIVVALVVIFAIYSGYGNGSQPAPANGPTVTIETNPAPDAMAPAPEPAPAPAEIAPAPEPAPTAPAAGN